MRRERRETEASGGINGEKAPKNSIYPKAFIIRPMETMIPDKSAGLDCAGMGWRRSGHAGCLKGFRTKKTGFYMKWTTSAVLAAVMTVGATVESVGAINRPYGAVKYQLQLEGEPAASLKSFTGGGGSGKVVEVNLPRQGVDKALVDPRFDDIQIQMGLNMSKAAGQWVMDAFNGKAAVTGGKDGSVAVLDHNFNVKQRVDFSEALITEISFPALDSAKREPGYLGVTLSPGSVQLDLQGGGELGSMGLGKQKAWQTSNFRVRLGGLPCDRITKIESFKIKQELREVTHGEDRFTEVTPGRVEYPNLVFVISALSLPEWTDWYEKFLVDGQNANGDELDGAIELLSADLKTVLGKIELKGVGLKGFNPFANANANSEAAAQFTVELYVEQMTLKIENL